jgi:hypothetical protein
MRSALESLVDLGRGGEALGAAGRAEIPGGSLVLT